MSTNYNWQQPVTVSPNEHLSPSSSSTSIITPNLSVATALPSPPPLSSSSIPRSSILDHRARIPNLTIDIDSNKLSTIKRSQAIPNIQDLHEDSPVTFEIDPNELHQARKTLFQQNLSINIRVNDETNSTNDKPSPTRNLVDKSPDARSEYIEEEKPVLHGIHVKGATLNRLVRILIDSFDTNGTVIDDSEYPKVFFLMHKWIIESEYLSNMFYDLYKQYGDDYQKATNNNEKKSYKEYQMRVCQTYSYWIKNFPIHFDLDKRLKEACEKLQNLIILSGDNELTGLIDLSQIPSFDWMRQMTVRNQSKNKVVSLGFNNIESQTLAAQLTYIEWKTLRRITFNDYKTYAIKNTLQDNPRLERSIHFFNGLSTWIQCMVLSKVTPKQRAETIHKFLEVAKYLKELQNFNTCLAVIGGISHSALARLSKTMMYLSTEDIKFLGEMTDLLSSNSNYAHYRKSLSECDGFKIPIIGVHLKDIISLHVALQDRLEYDLINFRKLVQLSIVFRTLTNLQASLPPVQPNNDLINLLTLSVDLSYTEDEIYELSLAREPRLSVSSSDHTYRASSPGDPANDSNSDVYKKKEQVHSPVFADWAAGVSQTIDIQTIQRHVNAMVEAVFTTYDHDRDGHISHTEFEEIAQNFPFIDTFTVLDADQDGMISKNEMRSYFLRAKYHDLKGEFKHDFHETTYFKPTFCVHCTGLLWGLIKQGWKCKDCGINAHRHCKDQVVMECRQKRQNQVNKQSSVTDCRASRHSFHARRAQQQKATQTSDTNFSLSSSSSDTSETCTSSSDDEQQHQHTEKSPIQQHHWHLRKPSSTKRRKQILSDSNDDYYYTHPPSPQQATSLTTITSVSSTNIIPTVQLIPRGPLICSDSFEKWNDQYFTWNRRLPTTSLLTSVPNTLSSLLTTTASTTTTTVAAATTTATTTTISSSSEKTMNESDKNENSLEEPLYGHGSFLEGDVSDDDTCFTLKINDKKSQKYRTTTNYGSSQHLNSRKLSLTESLHSLPIKAEAGQYEIFERLRQAEEEKKRLEVENRAMKKELVRTKSQISSLKREMSSIQQLHLAQQVHAQLSVPTAHSTRKEHYQHSTSLTDQQTSTNIFSPDDETLNQDINSRVKNLSTSSNEETVTGNMSSPTQTLPLTKSLMPDNEETNRSTMLTPLIHVNSLTPPSDEQLRLYITETLQREKDSTV